MEKRRPDAVDLKYPFLEIEKRVNLTVSEKTYNKFYSKKYQLQASLYELSVCYEFFPVFIQNSVYYTLDFFGVFQKQTV